MMEHVMSFLSGFKPNQTLPPAIKHCEKHGPYQSKNVFSKIWTRCPACQIEESKAEEDEAKAREKAISQDAWRRKLGESGIPPRFQTRSLKNYVATNDGQKAALEFAKEFAQDLQSGRNALFAGKPGTGKTHLACGIALRAMYSYQATALFTTVGKMVRRIREAKSFDAQETESEAINVFTFPDLLIIDEIGLQNGSDAEARALFDVINERYERLKPTLFLSNLDPSGVKSALGPRVFDRIREDGGQVVVFDWDSYRGEN